MKTILERNEPTVPTGFVTAGDMYAGFGLDFKPEVAAWLVSVITAICRVEVAYGYYENVFNDGGPTLRSPQNQQMCFVNHGLTGE